MKITIVVLLLLGVVAAIAAAVLTATLRASSLSALRSDDHSSDSVDILIAARDLEGMTLVDAAAVAQRSIPASEIPQGALTSTVHLIGQVLASPMLEGQVFTRERLVTNESAVHLAATLPQGGRAMTILLPESSGVHRLLYPGCLVDVVASFRLPGVRGGHVGEVVSATLFQGVRVLAVGDRSIVSNEVEADAPSTNTARGRSGRLVTVLVDRAQAEALQLATAHGNVSLVLRNPLDSDVITGSGVLLSDLSAEIAARLATLTGTEIKSSAPPFPNATAAPAGAGNGSVQSGGSWTTVVLRGRAQEELTFPLEAEPREDALSTSP